MFILIIPKSLLYLSSFLIAFYQVIILKFLHILNVLENVFKGTVKLFFDFSEKDTFIAKKKRDVFILLSLTLNMLKITAKFFFENQKWSF